MGTILSVYSSESITISSYLRELKSAIIEANSAMPEPSKSDGWGVGFYQHGSAYLIKKSSPFEDDERIDTLTEKISSEVFIAQIRYSSIGEVKVANTQPFRYGSWLFAHQGSIEQFRRIKPKLKKALHPPLAKKMQGVTDSEHCFFLFLSLLKGTGYLKGSLIPADQAIDALRTMLTNLATWAREAKVEALSNYNFILSNGIYMVVARSGPALYFKKTEGRASNDSISLPQVRSEESIPLIIVSSFKFGNQADWEYIPNNTFCVITGDLKREFLEIFAEFPG